MAMRRATRPILSDYSRRTPVTSAPPVGRVLTADDARHEAKLATTPDLIRSRKGDALLPQRNLVFDPDYERQKASRHTDLYNRSETGLSPVDAIPAPARQQQAGAAVVTPPASGASPAAAATIGRAPVAVPGLGNVATGSGVNSRPTTLAQRDIAKLSDYGGKTFADVAGADAGQVPAPVAPGMANQMTSTQVSAPLSPAEKITAAGINPIRGNPFDNLDLSGVPGQEQFSLPEWQRQPTTSESLGQTARRGIDAIGRPLIAGEKAVQGAVTQGLDALGKPIIAAAKTVMGAEAAVPGMVADVKRGFTGGAPSATTPPAIDDTTPTAPGPAGVTNATAAQFDKPTKETPLPGTDTTPEKNIDTTEASLPKFGLSPDELAKKKQRFVGFGAE